MEDAGFEVEDRMYRVIEADVVDLDFGSIETYLHTENEQFFSEYIVLSTDARARAAYTETRHDAERMRSGSMSSHTEISLLSFSRFTQTANGLYIVISRIENTLVLAYTYSEHRAWMNDFLRTLGY